LRHPKPMPTAEVGRVADLNHEGEGVVREGKAAFVGGSLPGELIRFTRRRAHRQYDEAELNEVLEPAAERVVPRCAHFGTCGGCALQHLSGSAQLQLKQQQLRETLERLGRVAPQHWLPPVTGPEWQYRRRARLGARFVRTRGRSLVGFRERLSSHVAALERCEVLAPPVGELLEPLGALLTRLSIRERVPQIEVAVGDSHTVLVLRVLDPPTEEDRRALLEFEAAHPVRLYLQSGGPASVQSLTEPAALLDYALPEFDLRLQFEAGDFVQVNGPLNRTLVSRVVELLELDPQARVLDLYCGLGNFTLALARRAGWVVGVEGDAGLIARANANAQRNAVGNAQFFSANLANPDSALMGALPWARGPYSHVVLDPPRVGAREVLPLLAALRPQRVIYVSCHPGSLARDLGTMVNELGFTLLAVGVADMFPQTAHVESLAVLASNCG